MDDSTSTMTARIGRFWFIGAESANEASPPSILVSYSEQPEMREGSNTVAGGGEAQPANEFLAISLFADEIWPYVRLRYPWVGYRDHTYYPGGAVCWDGQNRIPLVRIDPAINTPDFLNAIASRFDFLPQAAKIVLREGRRARAKIGAPDPNATPEPEIEFASCTIEFSQNARPIAPPIEDRAVGALLGLAVGDALGTTLEFSDRDTAPEVRDMEGGGPFGLKPGEWTDDTSMALCLADSLIACRALNPHDLMRRFLRWYRQGENSVTGHCFDIGNTTRQFLERFEKSGKIAANGPLDPRQAGNGPLMRLAPVSIFAAPDTAHAARLAERQSETTHPARIAHEACRFFATLLVEAMSGLNKDDVLRSRLWFGSEEIKAIAAGEWQAKRRDEIVSSGYVVTTLEAALWSVWNTTSFEEALLVAVNLGHDSDTVGAVTGQLAGAIYGRSGIPTKWLEKLAWRERIEERAALLLKTSKAAR